MTAIGLYFRGLDQAQINALRGRLNDLAADLGYIAHRGPTAGQGLIAQALVALDAGELALVLLPDEQYGPAIAHLESLGEEWADTIAASLRAALERAVEAD